MRLIPDSLSRTLDFERQNLWASILNYFRNPAAVAIFLDHMSLSNGLFLRGWHISTDVCS
jgi:hypothetical protein